VEGVKLDPGHAGVVGLDVSHDDNVIGADAVATPDAGEAEAAGTVKHLAGEALAPDDIELAAGDQSVGHSLSGRHHLLAVPRGHFQPLECALMNPLCRAPGGWGGPGPAGREGIVPDISGGRRSGL
jgi:hypothetical protein